MLILVLTIHIYQAFILLRRHARKKPIAMILIINLSMPDSSFNLHCITSEREWNQESQFSSTQTVVIVVVIYLYSSVMIL